LQYVTSPEVNNAVVNKLGAALPLALDDAMASESIFSSLVEQYVEDVNNNFMAWHAHHSWGIMGFTYWSEFNKAGKKLATDKSSDDAVIVELAKSLNTSFQNSVSNLYELNTKSGAWDAVGW
jgi:hypothetical protein